MSGIFRRIALPLIFGVMWSDVALSQDITTLNTLETHAPATIDAIKISNQNFAFRKFDLQKYGGLQWPIISFNVSNKGSATIKQLSLRAVLKAPSRSVPYAQNNIDYAIPGGTRAGRVQACRSRRRHRWRLEFRHQGNPPQGFFLPNGYGGRRRRRKQARQIIGLGRARPHRHMPRILAPTSTRTCLAPCRSPDSAVASGHVRHSKRCSSAAGMKRVRDA